MSKVNEQQDNLLKVVKFVLKQHLFKIRETRLYSLACTIEPIAFLGFLEKEGLLFSLFEDPELREILERFLKAPIQRDAGHYHSIVYAITHNHTGVLSLFSSLGVDIQNAMHDLPSITIAINRNLPEMTRFFLDCHPSLKKGYPQNDRKNAEFMKNLILAARGGITLRPLAFYAIAEFLEEQVKSKVEGAEELLAFAKGN